MTVGKRDKEGSWRVEGRVLGAGGAVFCKHGGSGMCAGGEKMDLQEQDPQREHSFAFLCLFCVLYWGLLGGTWACSSTCRCTCGYICMEARRHPGFHSSGTLKFFKTVYVSGGCRGSSQMRSQCLEWEVDMSFISN